MSERAKLPERIDTARLVLRRPELADIEAMVALANNPKMPLTTATLPFPFSREDGEAVVASAGDRDAVDMFAIALGHEAHNQPPRHSRPRVASRPRTGSGGNPLLEQHAPTERMGPRLRGDDVVGGAGTAAEKTAINVGVFIGCILFKYTDGKAPEIGYWLGEPYWGQGFAGEAVAALMATVENLDGFDTVDARVLADNAASTRVLEKAGFAIIEHTQSVVERHRGKPLLILRRSAA